MSKPTNNLTAYDLYLRALPLWRSLDKPDLFDALKFLEQAVEHDPRFGPALALAAVCRHLLDINGWMEDKETNRGVAVALARRALRVAFDDPDVLSYSGFTLAYYGEDLVSATALIDRALALNTNFARGWFWSGWVRLYAGEIESAIRHIETSMRLSPRDRWAMHLTGLGIADFFARRFEEAAAKLRGSLDELPGHATIYRFLAASYAHIGKLDEARDIIEQLRALSPVVMPSRTPFRVPEHRELLLKGLRLATDETR